MVQRRQHATTETGATPKRLLDDPGYAKLKARLDELIGRKNEIERDLRSVEDGLRKARIDAPTTVLREAQRLLLNSTAGDEGPTIDKCEEDLTKLRHDQAVVVEAVALQRRIVSDASNAASLAICKANEPEFAEIVSEIGDALLRLRPALEREWRFRRELADNGVSLSPPLVVAGLGEYDRTEWLIDQWLKEFGPYLN